METAEETVVRTAEQVKEEGKIAQSLEESRRTERTTPSDLLSLVVESTLRQDYAKQIVEAELGRDAFDQDWRLAKVFALSGAFADIKGISPQAAIATAMAKIQLGRSWGIVAADAMQFIYFNQGRPSVQNELIASKLQDGGWTWALEWQRDGTWGKAQGVVTGCRLWPSFQGKPVVDTAGKPASIEFSKAEADKAVIWEKGKQMKLSEKWNYQSWPEDMYYSKCIARLKRRHAPNILRGAVSQEEVEDYSEPPAGADAPQAQTARAATETKTTKLAEKLKQQAAPKEETPEARRKYETVEEFARRNEAAAAAQEQPASGTGTLVLPLLLGNKDGLNIFADFPPRQAVPNRQKFFLRQNGEDKRYYFSPEDDKFLPAPEVKDTRTARGDLF
jgi:hypothetical protein